MTGRQKAAVAIAGVLTIGATTLGVSFWAGARGDSAKVATRAAASPMRTLAEGIGQGDQTALTALCQRVLAKMDTSQPAVGEEEGTDLVEVLDGLRRGFLKFSPVGRASAVSAATHVLDRFRVEPAPSSWFQALRPIHDLVVAGLVDSHVDVRASALNEVGSHWSWLPGRPMTPVEENTLAEWKDAFYAPAVRCLSDREPKSRAAAVACVGALPIDSMAAPAVVNVEYPENGGVRYKALMTFSNRPGLLSVDAVLKRLHDTEPGIPELAELILKGRGLNKEQVYLGKQIFNPHPEIRASVIPLIRDRTDIDPVVWLIELSHDGDETVRSKSVEALIDRNTPEVDKRLKEIASGDASPSIRSLAAKHLAKASGTSTASLPPLPGSPSLNPKAN